jgi:Uma2 family endonuclease
VINCSGRITMLDLDDEPVEVPPLPDFYEVVNGEIIEVEPMSGYAGVVANRLNRHLDLYGARTNAGRSWLETLFRIPLAEDETRNRRPDVAFVTSARWPDSMPIPYRGNPIDIVPDLAVEVASPTDDAEALQKKVEEYLRSGVRLVWVIYPLVRKLFAYTSPNSNRIFTESDTLDAGDVLPGFSVPMASLFPPLAPEPKA